VLTNPSWRDQIQQHVTLRGADIDGTIDLSDSEIAPAVWLDRSRIEGNVNLNYSHWRRYLSLRGSNIAGALSAYMLHSESGIGLDGVAVESGVSLERAEINGSLLIGNHARFDGDLTLFGAKIGRSLWMQGASFMGAVSASPLSVGDDLLMNYSRFDGDVNLGGAQIGGNLEMGHSSFAGTIAASPVHVGGGLFMDEAMFGGSVGLASAKIGNLLNLRGSTAWQINLANAKMGEFQLGGLG
jgi:hypothetical protein